MKNIMIVLIMCVMLASSRVTYNTPRTNISMISPMMRYKLKQELMTYEGYHTHPYYDSSGKLHIGIGRNLEDQGIYPTEIDLMVNHDIDWAWSELNKTFPWFIRMDDIRQIVILQMYFNLGSKRFHSFKHMITALDRGLYSLAAQEMLHSKWATDVGDERAKHLAKLMETGSL